MAGEGFWDDQNKAQSVSKQAAALRAELDLWNTFLAEIKDLLEFSELAEEEGEESIHDEIQKKYKAFEKRFEKLEFATLFSNEYDKNNAIISIHAGSGGTEAQDWTEMLLRMLLRFTEKKEWSVEILSESRGTETGYKSITFHVSGRYAFGYLKSENGVHRLVRISPFDAEKMRHTTFALIEVIPEIEDNHEIEIETKDLRIDTFRASGAGGQHVNVTDSAVRITHIPTNTVVSCQNERSQLQNKESAMMILRSRLHKRFLEEQAVEKKKLRGEYKSAEWGNQIRSYVLHPYKMVKDLRTRHETSDTDAVLDGDLEPFMEAYLRHELSESDRFAEANEE